MNTIQNLLCLVLATALVAVESGATGSQSQANAFRFSCDVFSATTSAADLAARFGTANVRTAKVPWGGAEGDFSQGTVLFEEIGVRLEIHWRDATNKRGPDWASVRGTRTRWRTPAGITLGTTLRAIEKLNGRPFRLLGFGSDVSGTVMNWSGGRLEAQNTAACYVRLRVGLDWERAPGKTTALLGQVMGEKEFSFGHPAMQALNPTVCEMFLQHEQPAADTRMEPTRR